MATYIAQVLLENAGRLVQPGEEYDLTLPEGVSAPPEEVAVPKKKKKVTASAETSTEETTDTTSA